jgi:hypothetical protein
MYNIFYLKSLSRPYHEKELYTNRFAILDRCQAKPRQGRCPAAHTIMQRS